MIFQLNGNLYCQCFVYIRYYTHLKVRDKRVRARPNYELIIFACLLLRTIHTYICTYMENDEKRKHTFAQNVQMYICTYACKVC